MLTLKFKRLSETATIPTKAHDRDACFDLYADCPDDLYTPFPPLAEGERTSFRCIKKEKGGINIPPHKTVLVQTGFSADIPHDYWCAIFARSGLASKKGLRPAQGVPVIDEPYKGHWLIPLHNDTDEIQTILHGDRIAQFTLLPWFETELVEVDELETSDRGENGFGSSGK